MKILLPSLSSGALAMQMFLIMVVTASNSETIKKVIKANAASPKTAELDAAWNGFKATFKKSYKSNEDTSRKSLFMKTEELIQQQNKKKMPYTLAHNFFSDLTDDERSRYFGKLPTPKQTSNNKGTPTKQPKSKPRSIELVDEEPEDRQQLPFQLDLRRTSSCVGPIKFQGNCGSCWAFAAIFAIEYAQCKKTGKYVALSEQQLVDCIGFFKGRGCSGGWTEAAYDYLISSPFGSQTSAGYPYDFPLTSSFGLWGHLICWELFHMDSLGAKPVSYTFTGGMKDMMNSLVTYGGLSVCFYASKTFQHYSSGIFNGTDCDGQQANHCTGLVGYGTDPVSKLDYWILRNSWSVAWGKAGYGYIQRGVDKCGIESDSSIHYATVA